MSDGTRPNYGSMLDKLDSMVTNEQNNFAPRSPINL